MVIVLIKISNGNQDAIKNLDILKAINAESNNYDIKNGTLISYNGCADNINIPEGVTHIANGAFYSARENYKNIGIAGIILPSSLKSIDENTFTNLLVPWVAFGVSEYNQYFSVQDGVLFNKDKTVLIKYPIDKLESEYTVPNKDKLYRVPGKILKEEKTAVFDLAKAVCYDNSLSDKMPQGETL